VVSLKEVGTVGREEDDKKKGREERSKEKKKMEGERKVE
jgi:hypothetical protein